MRLFVESVVLLLALSFPGIDSKLEENITTCGDFFFEGKSPVIPGILEDSVTQKNDYKIICQKHEKKIRYATLYDTKNKIPVFSAYKYTGTNEFKRPEIPRIWMTELQLETSDAEMREPFFNQARNQDYWIKKNTFKCTPGTLFPMIHTADNETGESTYTLTNSVPQRNSFREGIWNLVESTTKESMDRNCRDNNDNIVAYVLTGAITSREMLNNRVNIPSFLWTAFCCYNSEHTSWISRTYSAINGPRNETKITLRSLKMLQEFLKKKLGVEVELFSNNCTVPAFKLRHWVQHSLAKCITAAQQRGFLVRECFRMYRYEQRKLMDPSLFWLYRSESLHTIDDITYFLD